MQKQFVAAIGGHNLSVEGSAYRFTIEGGQNVELVPMGGQNFRAFVGNRVLSATLVSVGKAGEPTVVLIGGHKIEVELKSTASLALEKMGVSGKASNKTADLKAPMPGLVKQMLVKPGDAVQKGTPLLVLEAMKMENMIKAQGPGTVSALAAQPGDKVEKGQVLVRF